MPALARRTVDSSLLIITFIVVIALMTVHSEGSAVAVADAGAHGRRVAAGADHSHRGHLRNEDQVAREVGRDRMRARRLRDGLDQDVLVRVDHAEDGLLLACCGAWRSRDLTVAIG